MSTILSIIISKTQKFVATKVCQPVFLIGQGDHAWVNSLSLHQEFLYHNHHIPHQQQVTSPGGPQTFFVTDFGLLLYHHQEQVVCFLVNLFTTKFEFQCQDGRSERLPSLNLCSSTIYLRENELIRWSSFGLWLHPSCNKRAVLHWSATETTTPLGQQKVFFQIVQNQKELPIFILLLYSKDDYICS